jgi:hypothetical protein
VVRNAIFPHLLVQSPYSISNLLRQRSLIDHVKVGDQLLRTRRANDDRVSKFSRQTAVINRPPESSSMAFDTVFGSNSEGVVCGRLDGGLEV